MKSALNTFILLGFFAYHLQGQIITTDPAIPVAAEAVTVFFDATQGEGGLKDYTGNVYAHTGVLTNKSTAGSDWKYVKTDWGENTPETQMTRVSANLYSLEISPSIREYYGVNPVDTITHMAFVFRSADKNFVGKEEGGKDIFVEVFEEGLQVQITIPEKTTVTSLLSDLEFEASASEESMLSLYLNSEEVKSESGTSITHTFNFETPGDYWVKVTASVLENSVSDSVFIYALGDQIEEPLPEGIIDGINYIDDETVTLSLFAPGKEHVLVLGDFNQWTPAQNGRMVKDGDRFWITLEGLIPGEEYAFQYLVDGEIQIADPYTKKILDPWSDHWISQETYPNLKEFPPEAVTAPASVIQTAQTDYQWTHTDFKAPAKEDLVIYELLLRDFIQAHDWNTLVDSLDYFTRLGINAIELMPVNEFDGNESWGYNTTFYFATDKYYGPADDLMAFIDSCHGRGIAVIIDMVLNHSYGPSSLVQLYFDKSTGKPSPDNPWYNVDSPNPVFSWGHDFNHESQATKDFVDRVTRFWMEEYQVDGFRFDFTKGFTNTPGDGSAHDESRIAILKRLADTIWAYKADAYVILEHFSEGSEAVLLANYGLMQWGNANHNFSEALMGYHESGKSDFGWISYKTLTWNNPLLVAYLESHDEERVMAKTLMHGKESGDYNTQDLSTALERMQLAGAFFFTVPGPKMIWQFGELGYDFSIDYDCRVCNKPIRWDYYTESERRRLYQVWSALIDLKINEPAFKSEDFTLDVRGAVKRIEINHTDMDIRIIGNFDVVEQSADPSFSQTGLWYDLFSGDSMSVDDMHGLIQLEPGDYRIYTTKRISTPEITAQVMEYTSAAAEMKVYPNPVRDVLYMESTPKETEICVFDLSGRVVMVSQMEPGQDNMDLSNLPDGLYVIRRISDHYNPEVVKIAKSSY